MLARCTLGDLPPEVEIGLVAHQPKGSVGTPTPKKTNILLAGHKKEEREGTCMTMTWRGACSFTSLSHLV
jgi:hypothetical protein